MSSGADRVAKQDIAEVLVRYASGIDRRDWALFRTCFADDVHAEYTGIGVWDSADSITEFMEGSHAEMGHTMHQLSNLAITVTGDEATARSYVDAVLMAPDGRTGLNPIGYYDDELVRTADGWRTFENAWRPISPADSITRSPDPTMRSNTDWRKNTVLTRSSGISMPCLASTPCR